MLKNIEQANEKFNYIILRIRFIPFYIMAFILLALFDVIVQTENLITKLFKRNKK